MLQIVLTLIIYLIIVIPVGIYMYHIAAGKHTFADPVFNRVDGVIYKVCGVDPVSYTHLHPLDSVRKPCNFKKAAPITKLNAAIITAAEQQTMNYYMNIANLYGSERGRELYQEIGMIEEQHVTQYGALLDTKCSWLENLLMHEYTECYLYYSCMMDECDPYIKKIWEQCFLQELNQLHAAARLLEKYEKKSWQQVMPDAEFPELLTFSPQKEYVRQVLGDTVECTAKREEFVSVKELSKDADYYRYQSMVNPRPVSYTHLDVYKRQVVLGAADEGGVAREQEPAGGGELCDLIALLGEACGHGTLSLIHI